MTSTDSDRTVILIDARSAEEYAEGHVEGALMIDYNGGEIHAALSTLDRDVEYLIYCRSGGRSGMAAELMRGVGIANVSNLGGVEDAAEQLGLPIVR